jgi:hypothetical protein
MSEVGTTGWEFPDNLNTTSWLEAEDQDEIFSGWQSTDQSVNDSTWTSLTMNSERYDPEDLHSTSSFTTRVSIPQDGIYLVTGCVYEDNARQDWRVTATRIEVDGAGVYIGFGIRHVASGWPAGHLPMIPFSAIISGNIANYIELQWYQRNTPAQSRTARLHMDVTRLHGKVDYGDPT